MHRIASRTANWFRRVFHPRRYHDPLSENFTFHILTEYLGRSQVSYGSAIALVDTGCPYNIISKSVVEELGCTLLPVTDTSSFNTFKGEVVEFVGKVTIRWGCTTAPYHSYFSFNPRYYKSVFYVVDTDVKEPYEIIIGSKTIRDEGLLRLKFAAPGRYAMEKPDSR